MATIPPSSSRSAVCTVSIIDTTGRILGAPSHAFLTPPIAGHDTLTTPVFSFLITHAPTSTTLLFDLGIRPDWHNLSGALLSHIASAPWQAELHVPSSVPDLLAAHGIPLSSINAIIWSHHHLDHIGDPSLFPATTKLVVGPGAKAVLLPGFPTGPDSPILETDYAGREMVEVEFDDSGLEIAGLRAHDYFGDGALYLLDAPGHARGHLCALARVADGDRFVLMAGDAFRHGGELRPSELVPLPERIEPSPLAAPGGCGCRMFRGLLRGGDVTRAFYEACGVWNEDVAEARRTVGRLQMLDGDPRVLVMAAHDGTLVGAVGFFPGRVEVVGGRDPWRGEGRWAFLKDFEGAVDRE
ncbi:metallo-beta-lactamase superfamily protein [Podospora conica]|nr:metallo-beta-lactamase superfamily protein [Schizothecium conicum]